MNIEEVGPLKVIGGELCQALLARLLTHGHILRRRIYSQVFIPFRNEPRQRRLGLDA